MIIYLNAAWEATYHEELTYLQSEHKLKCTKFNINNKYSMSGSYLIFQNSLLSKTDKFTHKGSEE
jgi:hypothetical protein